VREAQQDQDNPISFTTPDGTKGRVWLASNKDGSKIIGDELHWRASVIGTLKENWRANRSAERLSVASDDPTATYFNPAGPTPGALQGDAYPIELLADDCPVLPDCLRRQ